MNELDAIYQRSQGWGRLARRHARISISLDALADAAREAGDTALFRIHVQTANRHLDRMDRCEQLRWQSWHRWWALREQYRRGGR